MSISNQSGFKIPVGRRMSRKQSDAAPPELKMVSVAVLPPRLPPGMAPPTGVGAADAFGWDEAVNYQYNQPIDRPEPSKAKSFTKKIGLTRDRVKANPDMPPFTFRQVPYDTWRKHYAKDAEGNYRGTHAPAQDCLLKPDDVKKWRFDEEPKFYADKWTRGTEVLPVYAEVQGSERVPDYDWDHLGVPEGEPTVSRTPSVGRSTSYTPSVEPHQSHEPNEPPPPHTESGAKVIADGKTAAQIIEEAKNKKKPSTKRSWKDSIKRGAEIAMMGN